MKAGPDIALVASLVGDPDLLFLDEPTVGLDIGTRHLIWQQIRRLLQQGRTVVLTTHYLEEVDALANRVVVLNHGVIVAEGTSTEIKARTAQRRIQCTTILRSGEIESIAQVRSVAEHEGRMEICTSQVEPVLRELFLRDPNISGLEVSSSTLEEAFLEIVESGRQEAAQEVTV